MPDKVGEQLPQIQSKRGHLEGHRNLRRTGRRCAVRSQRLGKAFKMISQEEVHPLKSRELQVRNSQQ